jgi:hypothetical protein
MILYQGKKFHQKAESKSESEAGTNDEILIFGASSRSKGSKFSIFHRQKGLKNWNAY